MGILKELFAAPVYGRNGARGDVAISSGGAVGYGSKPTSDYSPMAAAKIRQRQREAQRRYAERRRLESPEKNAQRIVELLGTGAMSRTDLLTRLALDSQSFQAAAHHALESGLVDVHEYPANPKGGGRTAQRWSLRKQEPTQEPTQASRYWLQAPPGGAQLGGRPYLSGQFIPGTTMFTHTPQKPGAPVPYAPLPEPPQQPGMTQTGVAPQPDGTWAMPVPQTAGQGVQGAPQTVGGAAMFPSQPGMPGSPPTGGSPAPQSPQSGSSGLAVGAPPQARPDPNTPQLIRTPGLSQEDMVLEAQTQQFAWANYPALRDMYFQTNAVLDPVSGDVRSLRIDADAWRELLPGYTGTNATATHAAAVYLNSQLFREALQNQAGKGNNRMMVLAGGGGSGKGTAVNQFLETADFPLILDQTSRDYDKLAGQFEAARAAGMQPSYLFVDRPAPTALHGAVERALEERRAGRPARTVPLEMLARTNIDARRVALQVLFAQPDVDAQVIDNRSTGRFQRRMITDRSEAAQYLAHRLREDEDALNNGTVERLRDEIIARHKKGEIPADLVSGFLEPGWHIRPPVPLNQTNRSFRT